VAVDLSREGFRLQVDLDLPGHGITALFGPSGSGKTTCLRILAGLDRARGCVRVGPEWWQDDERGVFVPTHRRQVGYVFQDPSLFPHLSVRENLEYGRRRRSASRVLADVSSLVKLLGLGPLLSRRPAHLSGGECQRVVIARALLAGPRLLLMDEPLVSQDPARKAELLPYIERLRDTLSIPVIYVSHAVDEVARLADHLVILQRGQVVASGPATNLMARLDLPMANFDDGGVVIEARAVAFDEADQLSRVELGDASLWVGGAARLPGARVRVRVLARDVSVARERPGPSSILNVLPARVVELRDDGPDRVNVRLTVGSLETPLLARVTRRSRDALDLQPGLDVYALVKSVALVA
jgi:molybdate transport system ATP-binding protein